jgi:protein O-mannosyl-transferase
MPVHTTPRWAVLSGLLALLATAWLAYAPGLAGSFLFDDLINLNALGARGPIDDWPAFWRYLTSGAADPTGRPLALLSFLLDARDWPADPAPFLRTNLLLHLFNGALLFVLLRRLGTHLDGAGIRTDAAALLGTGIWLLHPLLVSTTLYIVQREAMLPASFVLLGLLAWLHGRGMLAQRPRVGTAWMTVGIGLGTVLAVLCKANGALLPLLALVLEATVLRTGDGALPAPAAQRLRALRLGLLVLPSLLLAAYLLWQMPPLHADLAHRPWTMAERLMTQPRVLLDYLQLLVLPRVLSTGLYNDGYAISTGLLQPPATLLALLAIAGLLTLGVALRRRAPALSAALLFFFAGHAMESSVVALELYYEHRNYLPALLLGWPLARALVRWRVPAWGRTTAALGLLLLLAATTWQRAALWGDPQRMALVWAAQNPDSPRAQATAAMVLMSAGRPAEAAGALWPQLQARPHEPQLAFNYADARCASGGLDEADVQAVTQSVRHTPAGAVLVHRWLDQAIATAAAGSCPGLDLVVVDRWLAAVRDNPALLRGEANLAELAMLDGQLALRRGEADAAYAHFRTALAHLPSPDLAARAVAALGAHGHPRQGLALLDGYLAAGYPRRPVRPGMGRLHDRVLQRQGWWAREFAVLRGKLAADLEANAPDSRPFPPATEPRHTR